jgi:hypothetical protein
VRPYLEKAHHKKGLVEWLKVKALSSSPSTTKIKKEGGERKKKGRKEGKEKEPEEEEEEGRSYYSPYPTVSLYPFPILSPALHPTLFPDSGNYDSALLFFIITHFIHALNYHTQSYKYVQL